MKNLFFVHNKNIYFLNNVICISIKTTGFGGKNFNYIEIKYMNNTNINIQYEDDEEYKDIMKKIYQCLDDES